ncbi:MAG: hypothetical protein HQK96_13740 [Nitrospirae bacterium]|nr:hypothetical protein [Nitrospirota bacterium]
MKHNYLVSVYRNDGQSLLGIIKEISTGKSYTFKTLEQLGLIFRDIVATHEGCDKGK